MGLNINPLADWVVAEGLKAEAKTASGLYLPDNAKEKSKVATVLAVGKDVKTLKKGEKILYKEYSTTDVKVDGTQYILVKEEDVLATVK